MAVVIIALLLLFIIIAIFVAYHIQGDKLSGNQAKLDEKNHELAKELENIKQKQDKDPYQL